MRHRAIRLYLFIGGRLYTYISYSKLTVIIQPIKRIIASIPHANSRPPSRPSPARGRPSLHSPCLSTIRYSFSHYKTNRTSYRFSDACTLPNGESEAPSNTKKLTVKGGAVRPCFLPPSSFAFPTPFYSLSEILLQMPSPGCQNHPK